MAHSACTAAYGAVQCVPGPKMAYWTYVPGAGLFQFRATAIASAYMSERGRTFKKRVAQKSDATCVNARADSDCWWPGLARRGPRDYRCSWPMWHAAKSGPSRISPRLAVNSGEEAERACAQGMNFCLAASVGISSSHGAQVAEACPAMALPLPPLQSESESMATTSMCTSSTPSMRKRE